MLWKFIRPLFFVLPPETAHQVTFAMMEGAQSLAWLCQVISKVCEYSNDALKSRVFDLEFSNPVGLAAGFDKDARLIRLWQVLGFGFAEVGTITPLPQKGNPKPRLFRLPADSALINRMGFNNQGCRVIRERLLTLLREGQWPQFPVGINLGKGLTTPLGKAAEDYVAVLDAFLDVGDYFVVNISSPNTPGLRELQEKSRLDDLLAALQAKNRTRCKPQTRPLLIKVASDLEWSQLDDVLELCAKHRLAGIIATNTTLSREGIRTSIQETGGLSGCPLRARATELIRYIYKSTHGKIPIIGVGGIFTAEDAYEKICAGASLIQVYTGFVYEGPSMVQRINKGLVRLLERDGFRHLREAIGQS